MASPKKNPPKSPKNEEKGFAITSGKNDNSKLRRELHGSFDLNQTIVLLAPADSEMSKTLSIENQNGVLNKSKAGKKILLSDDKKKRLRNMKMRSAHDEGIAANIGIDLELRLSASSSSSSVQPNQSNSSAPSSDLSYEHEGNDSAVSKAAEVPLVLMGCTSCYLYVMVPKNDPKCPKCESYILMDVFQGNKGANKRAKK